MTSIGKNERGTNRKVKIKTPDNIKKVLKQCDDPQGNCAGCPFDTDTLCKFRKNEEALEYIEQLEERIAIMKEWQKHGRWVKATGYMPSEYFGQHMCSVCEHFAPNYLSNGEWLSPVCPSCGAIMDKNK